MPPAGNQTHTSTFNMVLNSVGASRFGQSLGRAQDAINRVTLSMNRASAAAKTGRVSAEMQKAAQDRINATFDLASTRLELHRSKLQAAGMAANKLAVEETRLAHAVTQQQRAIDNLNIGYAKTQASGRANAGILKSWQNRMAEAAASMKDLKNAQHQNTLAVEAASNKERLFQVQLKAREARLEAMRIKMQEVQKPLSRFESAVATFIQIYHAVDKVSRTFDRLTLTAKRTLLIIDRLKGFFGGKTAATTGMMGAVPSETLRSQEALGSVLMRNTRTLGLLGHAAAYAIGQTLINLTNSAINTVVGLGRAALGTVASFERLNISLRAMLAVQEMNTGGATDLTSAIKNQTGNAAKLVRELEKIGIASPFSVENVKQAFQQGMGMGFAADQALRLTKASLDWAAATGKSGYAIEHVVFVMAQMRSAGKLVYQDLYQLAQLGIGMEQINLALAKSLGKPIEEIRKLRDAGKITAAEGIEALTQYMEQFAGSAKEQAETLEGLLNSLGDIGPIFLRNFFGPLDLATGKVQGVLGAIRVQLAEFVKFLQQEWVMEISRRIGVGLGNVATNAIAWGRNIISNLAKGFYQGVIDLINALTYIGNLLAYWLSPGSPPRLLPDLPEWGKAAMSEFFSGFALADISSFRDLTGIVEQVIRSTVTNVTGDKMGIMERLFGSRTAIGNLINELRVLGSVSEETFQRAFAAIGDPTLAMQRYIRTYVALAQQGRAVQAAQTELNRVTEYYNNLLRPVETKLASITEAQQKLVDAQKTSLLQLTLQDPNASAAEKDMARLEIERINAEERKRLLEGEAETAISAAQARLDAESARLTALQDELALQQEIINQENERNRLLQEYIDLIEQLAREAAAGGAGGAGGGGNPPLQPPLAGGFPNLPEPGKIEMPAFITDLMTRLEGLKTAWINAWTAISETLAPVKTALDGVKTSWEGMLGKFYATKDTVATYVADAIRFLVEQTAINMPQILGNISTVLDQIGIFWERHHETILGIINGMWRAIVVTTFVMGLILSAIIAAGMQAINGDWKGAWNTVEATVDTALVSITGNTNAKMDIYIEIWKAKLEKLKAETKLKFFDLHDNVFVVFFRDILTIFFGFWRLLFTALTGYFNFLKTLLGILLFPLVLVYRAFSETIDDIIENMVKAIQTWFVGLFTNLRLLVALFADLFRGDWEGVKEDIIDIWQNTWDTLYNIADLTITNIIEIIQGLLGKIAEVITAYNSITVLPDINLFGGGGGSTTGGTVNPTARSIQMPRPGTTGTSSNGNIYNLNVTTQQTSQGVISDFFILEAMD